MEGHLDGIRIGEYGVVKIDRKRLGLNAHCACVGPGAVKGHSTASMPECRLNRSGKKAPLGLLIAWLQLGAGCEHRQEHFEDCKKALFTDYARRKRARLWLMSQAELLPLLEFEAEQLGQPVGSVQEPFLMS